MKPKILIVGGDSLIGKNLAISLKNKNLPFYVTTRKKETLYKNHIDFDLSSSSSCWKIPKPVKSAIICAGITRLDACEKNAASSYHINVEKSVEYFEELNRRGIYIVYLSTNQVFNGRKPCPTIDTPSSPVSVYGSQKAEVERYLISNVKKFLILRLTKVLHPGFRIFDGWVRSLKNNEPISPFSNMFISPLYIEQVSDVLIKILIENRLTGILQLSGNKDLSYAQIAYYIAKKLNKPPEIVKPVIARVKDLPMGSLPLNTKMDANRIIKELNFFPMQHWDVIDKVINNKITQ